MSKFKIILTLIVVVLISIFAVQNYNNVSVKFLVYQLTISQALIIILSVSIGIVIGLLTSISSSFKSSKIIKNLNSEQSDIRKKYEQLEKDNYLLQSKIDELNNLLEKNNNSQSPVEENI